VTILETGLHYPLQLDELPQGWEAGYVGDFANDIEPGFASGEHNREGTGVPHLRPMNIDRSGKIDLNVVKYVDPAKNGRRLRCGDVLFNNTNSPELIGKTTAITKQMDWAFSNHMTRIVFSERVDSKFAAYQLHFLWMTGYFLHKCVKHVNQASISSTTLARTVPFIRPPLDQQKAIVAEIEKQFSRLDEAVANLRRVKANLKRYKAAVLKAAVEGSLITDGAAGIRKTPWNFEPIDVAIASLDQGWSPRCDNEPSRGSDSWGVIKTTAVQSMRYVESENKRLPAKLKPRSNLELNADDLLITRAGPRARVGVACLVKITRRSLMLCDKVYRLRCKPEIASPAYLELVLNAPQTVDALNELKTGISDSGVNLTQKRFRELVVPIPPRSFQERIVAEVERRLSINEELTNEVEMNLKRAERLRQSILHRVFAGNLLVTLSRDIGPEVTIPAT
jgi:type I restriction enzyme, S subunit